MIIPITQWEAEVQKGQVQGAEVQKGQVILPRGQAVTGHRGRALFGTCYTLI